MTEDAGTTLTAQQLGGIARAAQLRELKAREAAGDRTATRALRKVRRIARANGAKGGRPKRVVEP